MRLAAILCLMAGPAVAQQQYCAPHHSMVAQLAALFAESRRMVGIDAANQLVEVFASEAGTWKLIVTTPDGRACIVGSGDGFEVLAEALPPAGVPG